MKLSDALEEQMNSLAQRIAEAKEKEANEALAMEREPERPTNAEDCPVIYWTRELETSPAKTVRAWVKITDADGNERNVQELVDKPAEVRTYTYRPEGISD